MIVCLRPMSWCLLALHFSALAGVSKAAAQDATAYQRACRDCHPAPAVIVRKLGGKTEDESKAYLKAFLTRHHAPDPEKLDQIIDYLLMLPKK